MENILVDRGTCYKCNRPQSSCMCKYTKAIDTNTKFIILMHPKEHRKTKNGTGKLTHLNLKNSELFIGIDFSKHQRVNELIKTHNCYVLYPGENSINLSNSPISNGCNKKNLIFIIDSTWPCSKKMLRQSPNIASLPKVSFEYTRASNFKIKTQPNAYCLSTIESTLCVLELLTKHKQENLKAEQFNSFLKPFEMMVEYQVNCAKDTNGGAVRYKLPYKKE